MQRESSRLIDLGFRFSAIILALLFTTLVLLVAGAPPIEAFRHIILGSVGSVGKISDVLVAWVPLLLATAGLLVTFSAGLWNIGIEGQITLGAIFTTGALRALQASSLPPAASIAVAVLAGAVGGALWALLAGALKTYGGGKRNLRRPGAGFRRHCANALVDLRPMEAAGCRVDEWD